jgi:hypothetical protein
VVSTGLSLLREVVGGALRLLRLVAGHGREKVRDFLYFPVFDAIFKVHYFRPIHILVVRRVVVAVRVEPSLTRVLLAISNF